MKILVTNAALDRRAGTELVVDEIARGLTDRGHQVTVFTPRPGKVAQDLSSAGIPVVSTPEEIPNDIEIIHGQHHLPTMIALAALPETAAIYFVHGFAPWEEQPPLHPRVTRYLCAAPRLQMWLHHIREIPIDKIAVLPNWVDLHRFTGAKTAPQTPRNAVVFANSCDPADFEVLGEACGRFRISLHGFGRAFGNESSHPESLLPEFDIAFASGRSALEAMASGCAVIPFRDGRVAPMVTPRSFDESAERNFTVEPDAGAVNVNQVVTELRSYCPNEAKITTERIRREFDFAGALDTLIQGYRSTISEWRESGLRHEIRCEFPFIAAYLAQLAGHEVEQSQATEQRVARLKSGWEGTKRKRELLSEAVGIARKKLKFAEDQLSGTPFRKRLRHRIEKGWQTIEARANSQIGG